MTQTFYTKWQFSVLADAGGYVSKEYNNFQTALLSEISKYAKIELDSFLIRTARHAKDYTGGINQYCDMSQLQSMIDKLLS